MQQRTLRRLVNYSLNRHRCSRGIHISSIQNRAPPLQTSSKDDEILQSLFDHPLKQQSTRQSLRWLNQRGGNAKQTGLLMESRFVSPQAFRQAGIEAVAEADALVTKVVSANTFDEQSRVIKCLDQLSDALCRVMDVAELVRQVHPDQVWQQAAEEVYSEMLVYMNGLNTHVGLYQKLVDVMDDPSINKTFSSIEREVASSFRRDFERSGIHLHKDVHAKFVQLSSNIQDLSRDFLRCQSLPMPKTHKVEVLVDSLSTLPPQIYLSILKSAKTRVDKNGRAVVDIVPQDYLAHYILRDCEDPQTRESVYRMWQRGSSEAVSTLEDLLQQRQMLAHTIGFESYGHMALDDKMVSSPEHVDAFLRGLAAQAKPQWNKAVQSLYATRAQTLSKNQPNNLLYPWDRDFWMCRQQMESGALPSLQPYFSLGRVVSGLSQVFRHLYGVELRAAVPQLGEVWHEDVRKLEVVSEETGQLLGIVYCDVFQRNDKSQGGAAHFTARCARRIDNDVPIHSSAAGGTHSSQTVVERDGKKYQLPVVVLICDFPQPDDDGLPCLLTWHNVETIFHEMGHAMHSMLGQNGFHNVAGTRCPVDFVELPSILMEHFARSHQVLSLFASHYKTGEPLPYDLVAQHAEQRRKHAALELRAQLFMAALDQVYHSTLANSSQTTSGWSTQLLANLHEDSMFSSIQRDDPSSSFFGYVKGTQWQSQFTHLIGYGASYYAYLFDRVLAGQIWNRVFGGDRPHTSIADGANPLNREGGERFKNEVLRWGGGRNPWQSLAAVLDNGQTSHKEIETIARGSKSAMGIVGNWRQPDF